MNIATELRKLDTTRVNYQGEDFYINKHEISKGIIKLFTNKRTLVILEEDFDPQDFIHETTIDSVPKPPVLDNKYMQDIDGPVNTSIIGQNAVELTGILMENIRRVKEDPSFIPQAEAINSGVKTIIDVAKTQIDAFKAMRGV